MSLTAHRVAAVLSLLVVALLGAHVAIHVWHHELGPVPWLVRQLLDVDEENNLPTWYSSAALLVASLLLYATARNRQAARDPWSRHWLGLALGFLLLSVDEVAGIHETLNTVSSFSWTLPGGVVIGVVAVIYLRFLAHLPRRVAILFVLAGAMFVTGAIGVELATDWYEEAGLLDTLAYSLWTAVEEGLEMGGVVVFIYALLSHMSTDRPIEINVARR